MFAHPTRGTVDWATLTEYERVLFYDFLQAQHETDAEFEAAIQVPEYDVVREWHKVRLYESGKAIDDAIKATMAARPPSGKDVVQKLIDCWSDAIKLGNLAHKALTTIAENPDDHHIDPKAHALIRGAWGDACRRANKALSDGTAHWVGWQSLYGSDANIIETHAERHRAIITKRHEDELKQSEDMWKLFRNEAQRVHNDSLEKVNELGKEARKRLANNELFAYTLRQHSCVRNLGFSPDIADGASDDARGRFYLNDDAVEYINGVVKPLVAKLAKDDKGVLMDEGRLVTYAMNTYKELLRMQRRDKREANLFALEQVFTLYNTPVPTRWYKMVGHMVDSSVAYMEFYEMRRKQTVGEGRDLFIKTRAEKTAQLEVEAAAKAAAAAVPTPGTTTAPASLPNNSPDNGAAKSSEDNHTDPASSNGVGIPCLADTPAADAPSSSFSEAAVASAPPSEEALTAVKQRNEEEQKEAEETVRLDEILTLP